MRLYLQFCVSICIAVYCGLISNTLASFVDTDDHQYQISIAALQERGVVQGYPDGTYRPDQTLTRAEMTKIVMAAAYVIDPDSTEYQNCFPDVSDERFATFVCLAQDRGVVQGYPDGSFQPARSVLVAEGLKIAIEAFGHNQRSQDKVRYGPYIDFVHENNIFSRYSINPHQDLTRGRMAYLVHQLILETQGTLQFDGQRDIRSLGCLANNPSSDLNTFQVYGDTRSSITVRGRRYDHDTPARLIIARHGRTSPASVVRGYMGLERYWSDKDIIVYPRGRPEEGPSRSRSNPGDTPYGMRDLAFFDTIVTDLSEHYCIDMDQIHVVGHSLGAWFANSLSCLRGDVIRSSATVGGAARIVDRCAGPSAALLMHHPDDRLAYFGGGKLARDQMLRSNSCSMETTPVGPDQGNCIQYSCIDDAPVVWCPHSDSTAYDGTYYPHTRPNFAGAYIRDWIANKQ